MKTPADLTEHSIPFIHGAAGAGIDFITNNPSDPNLLPKLQQILMDIQKEVTPTEAASDEVEPSVETVRPDIACSQCYAMYHNNPPLYQQCLLTCT